MGIALPNSLTPPASNPAVPDRRNDRQVLLFDAATEFATYLEAALPDSYAGGGLTVDIYWMGATATTGDVKWGVSVERIDLALDQDADSFAAERTVTTTCSGTSGVQVKSSVAFTSGAQMDSLAAGESFRIKIARKAADAADTMAGFAQIARVVVRET